MAKQTGLLDPSSGKIKKFAAKEFLEVHTFPSTSTENLLKMKEWHTVGIDKTDATKKRQAVTRDSRQLHEDIVLKEFPDDPIPMPSDHLIELVYEFASLQARDRPTTHHTLHPSALLASAISLNEYIVHMLTPLVKEHVMTCLDEEFRVSRGEDEPGADEEADEPVGYISSGSDLDEDELLASQAFPPASKTSKFTSATIPTEQILPDLPASKPPNMPPKISTPNVRAPIPEKTADPTLLSPPAVQPSNFSAPRAPIRTKATSSTSRSSPSSRLSPAAAKRLAAQQAAAPLSVETVVSSIQDAGMRSELERLMRVAKSTQKVRTRRKPRTDDSENDGESDGSEELTDEEQAHVPTTRSRTRSNTKSTSSKASSVAKTDSSTAMQSTPTATLPAAKKSTSNKKTGKKVTAASPTTVAKRASPKKPTVAATITAGSDEENGSNRTKKDDEKDEPSEYKVRAQDNQEAEDDEMEPPQPKRPRLHETNNG